MDKILIAILAVILIFIFIKIITAPMKLIVKVIGHIFLGLIGLFIFNFIGSFIGISLDFTWFNALITGLLGIPGLLLLLIFKFIL